MQETSEMLRQLDIEALMPARRLGASRIKFLISLLITSLCAAGLPFFAVFALRGKGGDGAAGFGMWFLVQFGMILLVLLCAYFTFLRIRDLHISRLFLFAFPLFPLSVFASPMGALGILTFFKAQGSEGMFLSPTLWMGFLTVSLLLVLPGQSDQAPLQGRRRGLVEVLSRDNLISFRTFLRCALIALAVLLLLNACLATYGFMASTGAGTIGNLFEVAPAFFSHLLVFSIVGAIQSWVVFLFVVPVPLLLNNIRKKNVWVHRVPPQVICALALSALFLVQTGAGGYIAAVARKSPMFRSSPPSQNCLTGAIQAKLGKNTLYLSPVPFFDIDATVRKQGTDYGEVCDDANDGKSPISAETIDIHFGKAVLDISPYSTVCIEPTREWQKVACMRSESQRRRYDYPKIIRIYERGSSNGEEVPGMTRFKYDSTYEYFKEKAALTGADAYESLSDDGFQTFTGYSDAARKTEKETVMVTEDPSWRTPTGDPYALRCSTYYGSGSFCEASYPINDTLAVRYRVSNLFDAAAADRNVRAMLREIQGLPPEKLNSPDNGHFENNGMIPENSDGGIGSSGEESLIGPPE